MSSMICVVAAACVAAAACPTIAKAAAPCATPGWPPAASSDSTPRVAVWAKTALPDTWTLDPCIGWQEERMTSFAAVVGTFPGGNVEAVLARIGAISHYKGMRYWSVTDGRLETLITDAYAVEGPQIDRGRSDFTAAELQIGRELFFTEHDNRLSAPVLYRMTVVERSQDHLVVDITNVSKMKMFLLTLFAPGDLRTALFISIAHDGALTCYALSGFRPASLTGLLDTQKSHVNRLLALYGHLAQSDDEGLPWSK